MKKVSDYLREERERKRISLEQAARDTKIKKEYLSFIEEGKFSSLPSRAYALGFIKNYAKYLELPEKQTMAFFRRESLDEELDVVPRFRRHHHLFQQNFFLRTRGIIVLGAMAIILLYVVFQYGSLFFGPKLDISSPQNGQLIDQNVVNVSGKTDPSAIVTVDGVSTAVDLDGSFQKSVFETSGQKIITIISQGRFGKQTKKEITVKVQ